MPTRIPFGYFPLDSPRIPGMVRDGAPLPPPVATTESERLADITVEVSMADGCAHPHHLPFP